MARRDRFGADNAGVGPDPASASRLRSIDDVKGLDIAEGEPDIRGWEVRTVSGRRIGEVDDLLVDDVRSEVVMLDINLHDGDRHVEVPIRAAQLDHSRHRVIIDSGDAEPVGEAYDRLYQERLAEQDRERDRFGIDREGAAHLGAVERERAERVESERAERLERESEDRLEREREDRLAKEVRERREKMSAEDRLRAAERMTGERTMRGERTIREQGRPVRAEERKTRGVEEVVVEQRPVVIEETVVRRRPVGEEDLESDESDRDRI